MNRKLIELTFSGDPMQSAFKDDTGKDISMKEFIALPEKEMFDMLGLNAENLSLLPREFLFWYHVIVLVIRALKRRIDNENT